MILRRLSVLTLGLLTFTVASASAAAPTTLVRLTTCQTQDDSVPSEIEIYADLNALQESEDSDDALAGKSVAGFIGLQDKHPGNGPAPFKYLDATTIKFVTSNRYTARSNTFSLSVSVDGSSATVLQGRSAQQIEYTCAR